MANQAKNNSASNFFTDNRWLILLAIFVFLIYLLLPVLTPFLIAAILAYICDPLVDRLSDWGLGKFKLGRTLATTIVMFGIFGILFLISLILIPLLQKESSLVAEQLPAFLGRLRDSIEPWLHTKFGIHFEIDSAKIQDLATKNWKTAGDLLGEAIKMAGSHGMALIGVVANTLLLPVVLFYLLRDWDGFIESISQLVPREWHDKTVTIAKEIDQVLAEFLRGQLSVMLAMSFFYSAGLWIAGLDMALPIGLLTGLLGFVPYLGIATGLLLALLVAALQFSSIGQIIPVLAVFGIGQLVEGMWLTPKLVGNRIGLHPVIVIFALLAGGQLFGFAGVLLALPVSAAIAVALRHTKDSYLDSDAYLK